MDCSPNSKAKPVIGPRFLSNDGVSSFWWVCRQLRLYCITIVLNISGSLCSAHHIQNVCGVGSVVNNAAVNR
jgi:hypothetical protein